jgi:hypothetical protein
MYYRYCTVLIGNPVLLNGHKNAQVRSGSVITEVTNENTSRASNQLNIFL